MAKKFFPKALSVGLSLALCASLVAPALAHTVTYDGTTKEVGTVQAGVDEIANNSTSKKGTITMTSNDTTKVTISLGQNVDLDLNGYDLTTTGGNAAITVTNGSLTINDTTHTGEEAGTISGVRGVLTNGKYASVEVAGGNVTGTTNGVQAQKGSKATISGGSVEGEQFGVYVSGGAEVTVTGEDTTVEGKVAGVAVYSNSKLTVENGQISSERFGIAGNGTSHGTTIVVEGGTVTGDYAGIYHPQDGTLIIGTEGSAEGPTITGTGNNASGTGNGVQMCAGEATIYGGTIKGSGESDTENKTGDGVIPDGSAISAVSRKGYGKEENRTEEGYSQPKVTIHVDHVNMDPNDTTFQWDNSEDPGQKPADWDGNGENSGIFDVNHTDTIVTDPYVAPTYTSIGWTEGSHCSVCGKVIVPQQPIPMLLLRQ